jgi:hypothetical protein
MNGDQEASSMRGADSLIYRDDLMSVLPAATSALGWATVDLDRAEANVRELYRMDGPPRVTDVADDELLGARARLLEFQEPTRIVLLEPTTEGRIAASLARYGEGNVVVYVIAEADFATAVNRVRRIVPLSAEGSGPFGREALVLGPRWGAHLILAANERQQGDQVRAGTIER